MIITRSEPPENNFRCFKNSLIRDLKLSHRARGILLMLLSNVSGFQIVADDLQTEKEGREAVRTAIRELITAGFIRRERKQNDKGHWITETYVYDSPKFTEDGFPGVGYPEVGLPEVGFSGANRNNNNKNNNKNPPAPPARNTPEPPAQGANPPPTAGECVELFKNHEKWPELLGRVKKSSQSHFRSQLARLTLRGGGAATDKHVDAIMVYLLDHAHNVIGAMKGILDRGGWDPTSLANAARPGETAAQAKNRLAGVVEQEHAPASDAVPGPTQEDRLASEIKANLRNKPHNPEFAEPALKELKAISPEHPVIQVFENHKKAAAGTAA
jgi:predicted transcriptional regulator